VEENGRLNLGCHAGIYLEGLTKTTKILGYDSVYEPASVDVPLDLRVKRHVPLGPSLNLHIPLAPAQNEGQLRHSPPS
jgi:hypothetical protein